MRFWVGIILAVVGLIGVFRPDWIISMFGRNRWAESTMIGSSGSRGLYKFLGIIVFLFSLLYMLFHWPI